MIDKKNMEKIYEKFMEDIEPTEEMSKIYDEAIERMNKLKYNLKGDQLKELEELEDLFSKISGLETKEAFFKGFSVATNLILEARE